TGERARIVITTLQKFPFVMDKVQGLPDRRYAVIVDEAHSSQSGDTAKELRRALGVPAATDADDDLPADAVTEALAREIAARGRQANMSFFAFTATPKGKTLELFGRLDPATERHEPFHLY
ncbi:MAG: type I restriction endonuclease subunit R, partial [Nocardioidaceae bacterium]